MSTKFLLNVNECGEFASLGANYIFSTENPEDVAEIAKLAYAKYKELQTSSGQMIPAICICIDDCDYEIVSRERMSDTEFYPKEITESEPFASLKQALEKLIRKDNEDGAIN